MALVPASVWVSQKVDETYRVSIEAAEQKAADAAGAADGNSSKTSKKKSESTESKNVLEQLADGASGLVASVTNGAKQVTDLIEGVIVMIVTSCVIPLLVLAAFLWLGHTLLGIDISGPANYLTGRFLSAPSKHAKKSGQSE